MGGVTIENFSIIDSYLNSNAYIFSLLILGAKNGTINNYLAQITMKNMNVANTMFRYAGMLRLTVLTPRFIAAIENVHFTVTNFRLSNVSLEYSSIIYADGFLSYITDFLADNITLNAASNFYLSTAILSTVFITNGKVKNLSLKQNSNFVKGNLSISRLMSLGVSLDGSAETRPFVICNCSFDSTHIESDSTLIVSTNPMIIIQQNTFTNIFMVGSGLLVLGGYPHYLSSQTYFNGLDEASIYYSQISGAFIVNTAAEKSIFDNYPELGAIYRNSRATISVYDPENSIFFVLANENSFAAIFTMAVVSLVRIDNFEITNGTIGVINNSFMTIFASDGMSVVGGAMIRSGIFSGNKFMSLNLGGYAFSFHTGTLDKIFLDSTLFSHTHQLALCFINAIKCKCKRLTRIMLWMWKRKKLLLISAAE